MKRLHVAQVLIGAAVALAGFQVDLSARTGPVRADDHSLVDENGPFLGLGVSQEFGWPIA